MFLGFVSIAKPEGQAAQATTSQFSRRDSYYLETVFGIFCTVIYHSSFHHLALYTVEGRLPHKADAKLFVI